MHARITENKRSEIARTDSFVSVNPDNVIISIIKKAESNDDLILRAYETARLATHATIQLPQLGRTVEAEFVPCEIKTWRIPRDESQPVVETHLLELEE